VIAGILPYIFSPVGLLAWHMIKYVHGYLIIINMSHQ